MLARGALDRVRDVVQLGIREHGSMRPDALQDAPDRPPRGARGPPSTSRRAARAPTRASSARSASDTSSATTSGFSGRGITRSPDPRRTRPARGDDRAGPRATRTASPSGSWTRRARSRRAPTGSINVAVPTCTAHAPASSSSTASMPGCARRRRRGSVRRASRARPRTPRASSTVSARDRRASRSPAPASAGASRTRCPSRAESPISVRPCAPARTTPRASSTTSGVAAGSFAKTGIDRHAGHRADDLRRSVRVRAEDGPLELLVGLREPHLDGGDLGPALQHARQPDELLERASGDRHDDRCAGTDVARQLLLDERLDARVLDPGRPRDAGRRFGDPGRGIPPAGQDA